MMTKPIIHTIQQRPVDGDDPIAALGNDGPRSTARQTHRQLVQLAHNLQRLLHTVLAHIAIFAHHDLGVAIEGQDGIDRGLESGTHFLIPAGRGLELDLCLRELVAEAVDFGFLARDFLVGVVELELAM